MPRSRQLRQRKASDLQIGMSLTRRSGSGQHRSDGHVVPSSTSLSEERFNLCQQDAKGLITRSGSTHLTGTRCIELMGATDFSRSSESRLNMNSIMFSSTAEPV